MSGGRLAIYWTPDPDSALGRFGASWLGRDIVSGALLPQPALPGVAADEQQALTQHPRAYGFHATLKPPFALASGQTRAGLIGAVERFAAAHTVFDAPALMLKSISGFLALVPSAPSPAIQQLAADCVAELDAFRAPAPPAEIAERRKAGLTPAQDVHLLRWGYPYVMDQYRFHLTLTQRLDEQQRDRFISALAPLTAPFCVARLRVDALALFEQPDRAAPFMLVRRFALR